MPIRWFLVATLPLIFGCISTSAPNGTSVTWLEEDVAVEDATVSLGLSSGQPVALVERNGKGAADVMVFCTPIDPHGEPTATETATVYKEVEGFDGPLYVAKNLPVEDAKAIRYRLVFPGGQEPWMRLMQLPAN